MKKFISRNFEDMLLALGCILILIGLAQWNAIVTWIVAGMMLIGWGFLIGKAKSNVNS